MKFSLIAFILSLALSLLSMGFLGIGLFYIAAAPLALIFPNLPTDINSWHGDWVWPALISIPMAWSFGFLLSGWAYSYFKQLDWTVLTLKTSYIVILLSWNLLIWLIFLLNISPEIS